jgi:hypothetical protein
VSKLSEEISGCITIHTQEMYMLRNLVNDINTLVFNRSPEEILPPIPDNFKKEYWEYFGEFIDFLRGAIKEEKSKKKDWTFEASKEYPEEIKKLLVPILLSILRMSKYPSIFYNMTLTHLITISEAFLNDFFSMVLISNPNMLKSGKLVNYEVILSFSSINKLVNHLAGEISKEILDENIDEVAKKINRRFSINISKFPNFDIIREAFYRRNVIVHNNCVADKKYCQKVKNSKIGQEIETDFKYMERAFNEVGKFIDYLDEKFSKKLRYERNPTINALLHPPDID